MKLKINDIAFMSIALALLVICSKITFQIGPIPITLQTLAVIFIGLFLGLKKSFIVFFCYILMGLLGLPVFSGGGGFVYVLQPSFGFIIGFLCSSLVTGLKWGNQHWWSIILKAILGLVVLDVVGLVYMTLIAHTYLHLDWDFVKVLQVGLLPFWLKDVISSCLAGTLAQRLRKIFAYDLKEEFSFQKNSLGDKNV